MDKDGKYVRGGTLEKVMGFNMTGRKYRFHVLRNGQMEFEDSEGLRIARL